MSTDNSNPASATQHFLDACRDSVSEVFSQALMAAWKAKEITESASTGDAVFVRFVASKALRGECAFQVTVPSGILLAQAFMGSPAEEATWNDDAREALEELLRQVAGRWATVVGAAGEVELRFVDGNSPDWLSASKTTHFQVSSETQSVVLTLHLSPELSAELGKRDVDAEAAIVSTSAEAASDATYHSVRSSICDGNLDLLMGLGLTALLRFGRRTMVLRDVLELSSGAVIELDRQVQDPVELLLDGKVIARGEVVIVDGNYGLRVTEVASAPQRANLVH